MRGTVLDYELIDFGCGLKLERLGANVVVRPEKTALSSSKTPTSQWIADASCESTGKNLYHWHFQQSFKKPWQITWNNLTFELRATISNNIGIFPEQAANWRWLSQNIKRPCKLLNLFGYTGAASLVAAQAGASVCHVDASKSAAAWGRCNQELSGLREAPIRWIVDDALTFVQREQRRESFYDAIILDPPAFGRSSSGTFKFIDDVLPLLQECKKVLVRRPQLILLNCYATGLTAAEAKNILARAFPSLQITSGELALKSPEGRTLSCSVYARATSL